MRFALAVGANLGNRTATIARARALLDPVAVVAASRFHETSPVGGPRGQAPYLNGVWVVETGFGPHQLLLRLQAIEAACGRTRAVDHGPRTLDLDLLLADDPRVTCRNPHLVLPHPAFHRRPFVLAPLVEVAAGWRHPHLGVTMAELARDLGLGS